MDNFETGMLDLTLELVGTQVLKSQPRSAVAATSVQQLGRRVQNGTRPGGWTDEDRAVLDRLIEADAAWARLAAGPQPGLGRRGLRIAADVLGRGGRVAPAAPDEFGNLRIQFGDRDILAFVNDHGEPGDAAWARLIETIGPFPESPATDRVLADFSIHGPFERGVTRRYGQIWVEIRVRLADVATAFLDLDNVAAILADALTDAARETDDHD
jgi:hypothetical protein